MRRIAAATVTAVALSVGLGLAAAPAGAAPAETAAKKATKSWVTNKGKKAVFQKIKAGGKYTRNGNSIKVRGYIQDFGRNGWAPGVQFRAWNNGQWHVSEVLFVTSNGVSPIDGTYKFNSKEALWDTDGTKLQVREIALKPTKSRKGAKVGAWKKLF